MKYSIYPKHCLNQTKQPKKYDFLILCKTKPLKKGNGTSKPLGAVYHEHPSTHRPFHCQESERQNPVNIVLALLCLKACLWNDTNH